MRIAVMGTGGVGGWFGGRLAATGQDVAFIARGAHLEALRRDGLRLTGSLGETHLPRITVTDDPASLGTVDAVLFCLKTYDTESGGTAIRPLLGPDSVVISLQNGVDSAERLGPVTGRTVLPGCAFISAVITEPGVIRTTGPMNSIVIGEPGKPTHPLAERFCAAGRAAGFKAEVTPDVRKTLWTKFVMLATNAAFTCLVRQPAGIVYHDPALLALARDAVAEAVAVGRAEGVALDDDLVERSATALQRLAPDMYASMYFDLTRGRRIEVDSLSGLICRLGAKHGVPTPVHAMAYACLKPYLNGAPGQPG